MDFLSDGSLILSTWDSLGAVYKISKATTLDTNQIEVKRIAWGLAEPLGLKVVNDRIFVLQKQELTELIDNNADGITDEYRAICNAWGATGNFHEFAFGLVYKDGYFFATLAIAIQPGGKSTIPQNKDRGKVIKIGINGSVEFLANGLRTPNGIGTGIDNEIFIADNQGDWVPACKILHLKPGAFYGNYSADLYKIGTLKEQPPVVWLPQNEIGNSASQPAILNMGPYRNQMVHGDVTHGGLKRVFVEKIKGEYQGVVFQLTQGLEGGTNRLVVGPDSNLYVGMIGNPGNWGQTHHDWFGLEALKWNGNPVFDILAIRSLKTGFEIEFTEPLPEKIRNIENMLQLSSWTYIPTMRYGGPKTDLSEFAPESIRISKDRTRLLVDIKKLKEGFVYHFQWNDSLQSKTGRILWSSDAWYTLNQASDEKRNPEDYRLLLSNKADEARNPENEKKPSPTISSFKSKVIKQDPEEESAAILEGSRLVGLSGCRACHKDNEKVLGPAFRAVAQKYKSDPATVKKLVEKVWKGGSGVWGDYAMAPQTHVKKDKIEKMVRWILSLN
jgi:cytochrome c